MGAFNTAAVASRSQDEEIADFEADDAYTFGFVIFFYIFYILLSNSLISEPMDDIYTDNQEEVDKFDEKLIDELSPDEDDRRALQNLRIPEETIDEQSPDEDDRQAIQSLRAPKRTRRMILTGESS